MHGLPGTLTTTQLSIDKFRLLLVLSHVVAATQLSGGDVQAVTNCPGAVASSQLSLGCAAVAQHHCVWHTSLTFARALMMCKLALVGAAHAAHRVAGRGFVFSCAFTFVAVR